MATNPSDRSTDIETPTGIGNVACGAVLEFRHHDRSNQLGDLAQGAYSDWTGYASRNRATALPIRAKIVDANRWQPLTYISSTGDLTTQRFMAAQGCYVTPFALSKGDEFRALLPLSGPAKYGSEEYQQQAQELVQISANLTDRKKMIAEYWSDVTDSEQPPGRWMQFARWISARDHHTLDDDVKMFFVLINALFDAGIAAWGHEARVAALRTSQAGLAATLGKAPILQLEPVSPVSVKKAVHVKPRRCDSVADGHRNGRKYSCVVRTVCGVNRNRVRSLGQLS